MAAPAGHLKVVDTRTDRSYEIPIHAGNYIKAKDLSTITITEDELPRKLNILDNGYESTACMDSSITHMYARCSPRRALILNSN
jgi:citrate synthase